MRRNKKTRTMSDIPLRAVAALSSAANMTSSMNVVVSAADIRLSKYQLVKKQQ